jgi:uncharacterized protein RhaS with RHS repeats
MAKSRFSSAVLPFSDRLLVKDAKGKTTTFIQNASGITTTVTNTQGFVSRIVLNEEPMSQRH